MLYFIWSIIFFAVIFVVSFYAGRKSKEADSHWGIDLGGAIAITVVLIIGIMIMHYEMFYKVGQVDCLNKKVQYHFVPKHQDNTSDYDLWESIEPK